MDAISHAITQIGRDAARKAAREAMWRVGDLSWALHGDQLEARRLVREAEARGERRFVYMCGRRWGKTRFFIVDAFEFALKNPGSIIPYAALSLESAEQFVFPEARMLIATAPEDDKPTVVEGEVRFKNGSVLVIAGTETQDRANRLRGRAAPRAYCDEAGFNPILTYVIESVLAWTLLVTDGLLFIGSSPPLTKMHPFATRYLASAIARGTAVRRKTRDAPHIKPALLAKMCDDMGGPDSVEWRREGECELLTDERRAVIPEFAQLRERVTGQHLDTWPTATHRDWYEAADLGYTDGTASLLAWGDFMNDRLVVEDERINTRPTSGIVQAAVLDMERSNIPAGQRVYSRVADAPLITIADMAKLVEHENLGDTDEDRRLATWHPALKDDLHAAVNLLRVLIKGGHLLIHPRCGVLLQHVEFGIWNKNRTAFERLSDDEAGEDGLKHFDALAALIYLARSWNRTRNPYPRHAAHVWHDVRGLGPPPPSRIKSRKVRM